MRRPAGKGRPRANPWRERRLYVFRCSACGRPKARTLKRGRARALACARCRKGRDGNANQMTIV